MIKVSLTFFVEVNCIAVPLPTQVEKMRTELANLNHCAVLFLSRAATNLSWYDSIYHIKMVGCCNCKTKTRAFVLDMCALQL